MSRQHKTEQIFKWEKKLRTKITWFWKRLCLNYIPIRDSLRGGNLWRKTKLSKNTWRALSSPVKRRSPRWEWEAQEPPMSSHCPTEGGVAHIHSMFRSKQNWLFILKFQKVLNFRYKQIGQMAYNQRPKKLTVSVVSDLLFVFHKLVHFWLSYHFTK